MRLMKMIQREKDTHYASKARIIREFEKNPRAVLMTYDCKIAGGRMLARLNINNDITPDRYIWVDGGETWIGNSKIYYSAKEALEDIYDNEDAFLVDNEEDFHTVCSSGRWIY